MTDINKHEPYKQAIKEAMRSISKAEMAAETLQAEMLLNNADKTHEQRLDCDSAIIGARGVGNGMLDRFVLPICFILADGIEYAELEVPLIDALARFVKGVSPIDESVPTSEKQWIAYAVFILRNANKDTADGLLHALCNACCAAGVMPMRIYAAVGLADEGLVKVRG